MKPLKITIITFSWPPRNAIGAHRPYSWAKYWSESGAQVCVLTAKKYSFDEPLDLNLPDIPNVKIIEVPYHSTYTAFVSSIMKGALRKPLKWAYSLVRKQTNINLNPRSAWQKATLPYLDDISKKTDIVVSTYDPIDTHLIACDLKKINKDILWIADYRDLWSQNHLNNLGEENRKKNRDIELSTVGTYADALTTVSDGLADELEQLIGLKPLVVTNGFDITDQTLIENIKAARTIKRNKPIRIVYTGKIYRGYRDPSPLLNALLELHKANYLSEQDISIQFYGGDTNEIEKIIHENKEFSPFVKIMGHVNRDESLIAQREADLLLLLESGAPEAKGVLTGKIFEYIATGVPILSLGSSRDSAISNLLDETACGLCVGIDVGLIKEIILNLLSDNTLDWHQPNITELLNYSRKSQALKMYDFIKENLD